MKLRINPTQVPSLSPAALRRPQSSDRATPRVIDTRNIRFRCKSSAGLTSQLNFISSYRVVPPRRPHTITLHHPPDSTWSDLSKSESCITLFIARSPAARQAERGARPALEVSRARASCGVRGGARAANRYGRRACVDLVPCIHALAL